MEQLIHMPVKQVQDDLSNSVLFEGQIGFVYGREIKRPNSANIEAWLVSSKSEMSWDEAGKHLYKVELKYQRQEMRRLANALGDWVAFQQREYGFDKLAVKAVFDKDSEDGRWFVGLEDITPEKNWRPNSAGEMMLGGLLENTLYELARKFDAAQYRNEIYHYEPDTWWSPTMLAMKMVEA